MARGTGRRIVCRRLSLFFERRRFYFKKYAFTFKKVSFWYLYLRRRTTVSWKSSFLFMLNAFTGDGVRKDRIVVWKRTLLYLSPVSWKSSFLIQAQNINGGRGPEVHIVFGKRALLFKNVPLYSKKYPFGICVFGEDPLFLEKGAFWFRLKAFKLPNPECNL